MAEVLVVFVDSRQPPQSCVASFVVVVAAVVVAVVVVAVVVVRSGLGQGRWPYSSSDAS